MSRQTWATLLALVLIVGFGVLGARHTGGDFALFSPGPTIDVLGKNAGKPIVTVVGHKTYRDDGQLRLVTIIPTTVDDHVGLLRALAGWINPDVSVFPYDTVYKKEDTAGSVKEASALQMTSSQDNATAAALSALGVKYSSVVKVSQVSKGGPAAGKLKSGDIIAAVDGKPVTSLAQGVKAIQAVTPGDVVTLRVRRGDRELDVPITTAASDDDPKKSVVKVGVMASFDFPFKVKVGLADNIGGPSAGMIFALSIYDLLTPGSLTGGRVIAGTGEIAASGKVAPIGGIQQKMVGAKHDHARLFLVPAENCAEAVEGHYDPDTMRLVRISTLKDAISSVQKWSKNPDADLPRCTAS